MDRELESTRGVGAEPSRGVFLGTYSFEVSADANGQFFVIVRHADTLVLDSAGRSIEVTSKGARIDVTKEGL
jgi:hypothetical protein